MEKILLELEQRKEDLLNEHHYHQCRREYCNPQGISNIYLCKFRQIHVCTPDECDLVFEGVCPISGACYGPVGYGNYDPNDNRTFYSRGLINDEPIHAKFPQFLPIRGANPPASGGGVGAPAARVISRVVNEKDVYTRIETYVEDLLYSNERVKINALATAANKKACTQKKEEYIARCSARDEPINWVMMDIIANSFGYVEQVLEIMPLSRETVARYTEMVLKVYKMVQSFTSERVCVESITLAVLYTMRVGYIVNDVQVLPMDPFLKEHLPDMNELGRFGFERHKFTNGENQLTFAFDEAIKKGII
jgi:hypothetical protein